MFRRGRLIAWLMLALGAAGVIATLGSVAARTNPRTAIFVDSFNYVTAYSSTSKGATAPLALTTDMTLPDGIARDSSGRIYVTNTPTNTVTIYAANSSGNVPPLAVIGGSHTQLASPTAIGLDANGKIYVLSTRTSAIAVYAPLGDGTGILNEAPIAIIAGAQTQLVQPVAIAVDANGDLYVANQSGGPATPGGSYAPGVITVYAAGSNGNLAPTGTIIGASTGLVAPLSIALDSSGDIDVGNAGISFGPTLTYPPSVIVYPAGSDGNAQPIAVISGSNTGLDYPQAIAVDSERNIYATSFTSSGNAIEFFPAGSNGNASPAATIVGTDTGLSTPNGIALDLDGNLYVSNETGGPIGNGGVTVYSTGSNGDAAPIDTISSSFTGIRASRSIAVDSTGRIYLTNGATSANPFGSVAVYPAGGYATGRPLATIAGDSTGLHFPFGIALDANNNISVLNSNHTVTVYRTGSAGNVAPRVTLNVDRSGRNTPAAMAVDAYGGLFVANRGVLECTNQGVLYQTTLGSVAIFSAGSRGNADPSVIISGPDTNLATPTAIAVSNRGNIFVANEGATCFPDFGCFSGGNGTVTVYAHGSVGDAKPIATIGGPHTGLGSAAAIAVDSNENIYVLNTGGEIMLTGGVFYLPGQFCDGAWYLPGHLDFGQFVTCGVSVFEAGSNGDVAPIATIGGTFTDIEGSAIAIGPAGP